MSSTLRRATKRGSRIQNAAQVVASLDMRDLPMPYWSSRGYIGNLDLAHLTRAYERIRRGGSARLIEPTDTVPASMAEGASLLADLAARAGLEGYEVQTPLLHLELMADPACRAAVETFDAVLKGACEMGPIGECFENVARLVAEGGGTLAHYEGFALTVIPHMHVARCVQFVHHAWAVDEAGRVVDPTWADGRLYVGVRIPPTLSRICHEKGGASVHRRLLDVARSSSASVAQIRETDLAA